MDRLALELRDPHVASAHSLSNLVQCK
jgi:hypothetical protein